MSTFWWSAVSPQAAFSIFASAGAARHRQARTSAIFFILEPCLMIFAREQAADGGAAEQMAFGGGQELIARQARRQVRLQVGGHHRDQIMMRPVALGRAGADIVGVAPRARAAGEANAR